MRDDTVRTAARRSDPGGPQRRRRSAETTARRSDPDEVSHDDKFSTKTTMFNKFFLPSVKIL